VKVNNEVRAENQDLLATQNKDVESD